MAAGQLGDEIGTERRRGRVRARGHDAREQPPKISSELSPMSA
jgi:hypothetical protein